MYHIDWLDTDSLTLFKYMRKQKMLAKTSGTNIINFRNRSSVEICKLSN